jgi:centractin
LPEKSNLKHTFLQCTIALTRIGRPKHIRVMAGAVEGDSFIGNKAQELRGILSLKYPMEHGVVKNWSDMEKIWQYVYSEELKALPEEVI